MCLKEGNDTARQAKKVSARNSEPQEKQCALHHAEPRCLGQNHASAGGKKEPRRVVQVVGPQKAFGGEARSMRDRLP